MAGNRFRLRTLYSSAAREMSCGLSATMTSDRGTVTGCRSICQNTTGDDFRKRYERGGCCQDTLVTYELTRAYCMDSVPVVLDWILEVHDYGERFRGKTDQSGNHSTPFCHSYDDWNTITCVCQPGMESSPTLSRYAN
ncbi:unnamed protein product [Prunus armeniaca]